MNETFEDLCQELVLCSEEYCPYVAGKIEGDMPCNAEYCHIAWVEYCKEKERTENADNNKNRS